MKRLLLPAIALIFIMSLATDSYSSPNRFAKAQFVPDESIVKLKRHVDITSLPLQSLGVRQYKQIMKHTNKHIVEHGLDRLFLLKINALRHKEIIYRLKRNPNIEYAEPNYIVHTYITPNDPDFEQLYGLHNTGQTGGTPDADIDAPEVWDIPSGNENNPVVIAVIDTGVDYNHEDLIGNMWQNPGEVDGNNTDDDGNGYVDDVNGWDFFNDDNDPMDDHSHGTHCAGTIGAVGDNGLGVVGVNWNIKIMPLKFLDANGYGTTADAIEAISYATIMGVDVMSNSWGGGGHSQALKDAIAAANGVEILFVAAAGNSASNNDSSPHYPSNYNIPNVVAVAATDHNDEKASFSSYGPESVDLGAPGVDIYSTVPADGYAFKSGTSMATPHVSGVAGLIRDRFPTLTIDQLKLRLLYSTDPIPSLDGITLTGGRLNAFNSLEDDTTPPGGVANLTAISSTFNSVTLRWTATDDDGYGGEPASLYDVRYSTSQNFDFDSATSVTGESTPQEPGLEETFTVTGLSHDTTYYFRVKVFDDVGNSSLSNEVHRTTVTLMEIFYDDMEEGPNGWIADSLWEWGIPTYASGPGSAYSGSKVWGTNLDGDYGDNYLLEKLTSEAIDLTSVASALLVFRNWYHTEARYDGGVIEISTDGGATWQYADYEGYDYTLGCSNPLPNDWDAFTGSSGGWRQETVDLAPYVGHWVQLRFAFASDCSISNYPGWYIDDVSILGEGDLGPNQPPFADAGGPYTGIEDEPVTFDGSASNDPEGGSLTYSWDFGDSSTGTGVRPSHVYRYVGTFPVTLIVNDGQLNSQPSVTDVLITDAVNITKAVYNASKKELIVEATSSSGGNAILTVIDHGEMTYNSKRNSYKLQAKNVTDPGPTATVQSDLGGEDMKGVEVKGGGGPGKNGGKKNK
jgi:hypothetical protein